MYESIFLEPGDDQHLSVLHPDGSITDVQLTVQDSSIVSIEILVGDPARVTINANDSRGRPHPIPWTPGVD